MNCPDCGSNNIVQEKREKYCGNCGLVLDEEYTDDNCSEYNYPLDDSIKIDTTLTRLELKHNYRSRSYERFNKFKQHYYDLFEDTLLENGYVMSDVPHIFYNHFLQWYQLNSKKIGNKKRIDVIYCFLMEWEV